MSRRAAQVTHRAPLRRPSRPLLGVLLAAAMLTSIAPTAVDAAPAGDDGSADTTVPEPEANDVEANDVGTDDVEADDVAADGVGAGDVDTGDVGTGDVEAGDGTTTDDADADTAATDSTATDSTATDVGDGATPGDDAGDNGVRTGGINGPASASTPTREATAPPASDTEGEVPADTTSASDTPTPAVASAVEGGVVGPAVIASGAERGAPTRSDSRVQVVPVPPPPPPAWRLPANSGSGRRVVYSKSLQRVWAVDQSGVVIKKHLVSGKQTPNDPRPGTYRVFSRSRWTFALQNPSVTWGYMVRFAKGAQGGNIGFHEIPYKHGRRVQSVSQLGIPLSGGCVRQSTPDAIWMWNWAQIGTKVVVLP